MQTGISLPKNWHGQLNRQTKGSKMRKLYFRPFVAISLMLVSGALLAQVSTSTKVLSFVGATRFNPGKPAAAPINQVVQGPDVDVSFDIPGISGNNSPARLRANFVPRPAGNSFASATFNGFNGLDQFSQAVAPTGFAGGDNGQLEPPDQGLAIGNGFVLEPINNAIEIFDTTGHSFGFEALSLFFGLPPTFFVNNGQIVGPFGPFLSDPRAYFDATNHH
jgi:hypothetical protein